MVDQLTYRSLSSETWKAFEKLFSPKGACGGCWCMTWRLHKADYERLKGDGNKKLMLKLIKQEEPIGILAFHGDEAVGWCAVAPREKYQRLEKSRALKPIDDKRVWSVSCFFIAKSFRRMGVSLQLLKAATDYARHQGASIIEAYPVEPKDDKLPDVFAWTGIMATFTRAGFKEEKRNTPARPILRYYF